MSFTLLGILNSQAAGAAISYWLSLVGGSSADNAYGVRADSDNNAYVNGKAQSAVVSGDNKALLVKYDTDGAIQWQRGMSRSGNFFPSKLSVDSSGNVYAIATTGEDGIVPAVAKYNSAGVLQWQKYYKEAFQNWCNDSVTDSSNNVILGGRQLIYGSSTFEFSIIKINSAGAIQWNQRLGGADIQEVTGVAVDSSDNVYFTGETSDDAGGISGIFGVYSSSGVLQFQRRIPTNGGDNPQAIAVDSSANSYVVGQFRMPGEGTTQGAGIFKFNSFGTLQWQKRLYTSNNEVFNGVAIDSEGNVYGAGTTPSEGAGTKILIAKYDSSGALQWQRSLGKDSTDTECTSIDIDSDDSLLLTGSTDASGSGGDDYFTAKLPSDGSLTGSYTLDGQVFVYAASSLTDQTNTKIISTSSFSTGTPSYVENSATANTGSESLTSYFVEVTG